MHTRFSVHKFTDLPTIPFSPADYSRLKFGSDEVAKKFGDDLARAFFTQHADILLTTSVVVVPSPYNFIRNAASIMTEHFINTLNDLLVSANGTHVETSVIHRKMSYTNDYGFLSKEKRKGLIDNDRFYLNRKFLKGKTLIFIDDVRITGTHEEKLIEILAKERMPNRAFFLYYAEFEGDGSADIEGALNFAGMKSLKDYLALSREPNHRLIVRPIKFILSQSVNDLQDILKTMRPELIRDIYNGCLGEGYYRIPHYQTNFGVIADKAKSI